MRTFIAFIALLTLAASTPLDGASQTPPQTAPRPSCQGDPAYRAFDFWIGDWDVQRTGVARAPIGASSKVEKILDGCVILENWSPPGGVDGKSFNIYNRFTKQWEQYWVDAGGRITHYFGQFREDGNLYYEADQPAASGKVRMTFFNQGPDQVRQLGHLSTDGGKTWKVSFDLTYIRKKGAQQRDPRQYQQTLENADRVAALQVDRVIATLAIKLGMRVADLGAGSGLFSIPLGRAVGPTGKVYAIDIDPGLLTIVADKARTGGIGSVQTVVAGATDPRVPEPVDLIFICDTMHHLPNQAEYVKQLTALLRPGGRVAVIDFREGRWPDGHESFRITPAQVDAWMKAAGLTLDASHDFLATNFFQVYRRTQ